MLNRMAINLVEVVGDVHDESSRRATALTHATAGLCRQTKKHHVM